MTRTTKGSLYIVVACLGIFCLTIPVFAQNSPVVTGGPIVKHPVAMSTDGPMLREIEPLLPEFTMPAEHEIPNNYIPIRRGVAPGGDQVTQNEANSPTLQTPTPSIEFEGLGTGDQFFCNCLPPDDDMAPGRGNQVVEFINLFYAVYSKTGTRLLGPLPGNSFWSGLGGSCQTDNSGDPIVRYDAAADRWVVSQFAINSVAPDFECVAVSQTSDATGAYNKYAFAFNTFPDYPKLSVWPDAYYLTVNNFNIAGTQFIGAEACALDRTKMLAGQVATGVCFQQNNQQFGEMPADLDGPTPPAQGTPNFVMEEDPTSNTRLDLFKFHVDFVNVNNSTFTGPTFLTVPAFTDLCFNFSRGRCVPQPGTNVTLESLGGRLMWRLVYRNFGDHTVLLSSHSVVANNGAGGVRWYEMRNPETTLTLFQSGTFAPDTQYRFMPAIAMDKNQDIAVGYTRSGAATGQFPSMVYAGRIPTDPAGTLETEQVMKLGNGSQLFAQAGRWGDYTALAIDPADDCTFWFQQEYLQTTGNAPWHTAIGSFVFPGCGGQGAPAVTLQPRSLGFGKTVLGTPKTMNVKLTNTGTAPLTISSFAITGDYSQTNNCPISPATLGVGLFCTIHVTFNPTAINTRTGTLTITDDAPNSPQTVPLTGVGTIVTFLPTNINFGTVPVGQQSTPKSVTLTNKSNTTPVTITSTTITGTNKTEFSITTNTCTGTINPLGTCQVTLVGRPGAVGARHATVNVFHNGGGSPSTASLVVTGQ